MPEKVCMKCGSNFECSENIDCWCFSESKLKVDEIEFDDCVCKQCLRTQYREHLLGN